MSLLYAIDPGLRQCGFAVFVVETKKLNFAALVRNFSKEDGPPAWRGMSKAVIAASSCNEGDVAVVEFPKVYTAGKQPGDPADLLELAAVIGELSARFEKRRVELRRVFPHEWKRQLDKATTKARLIERLSGDELKKIEKDDHNAWDAIGIGMFHLGRFERKRVIAR